MSGRLVGFGVRVFVYVTKPPVCVLHVQSDLLVERHVFGSKLWVNTITAVEWVQPLH
jgi:hypothetical protein